MRAEEINRFVTNVVRPLFGADFSIYATRDLVRRRGPFVQAVLFSRKKSGWLHVIPTFYVVGACPSDEVMFQTMSLPISGVDEKRLWRWPPDVVLDESLAQKIVRLVSQESPLSFEHCLNDTDIEHVLSLFCKKVQHSSPWLSRAYFNMCRGLLSAGEDLRLAQDKFIKCSRFGRGASPLDFETALLNRFSSLEARVSDAECIELCKVEVLAHVEKLRLPPSQWPSDWPAELIREPARKKTWLDKLRS